MKIWNYVFISIGLTVLFELAGMVGNAGILGIIGFSIVDGVIQFQPTAAGFFSSILGSKGILIGLAAGVTIGIITRSSPVNFVILPLITTSMGIFLETFVGVIIFSQGSGAAPWITAIISLLMIPFAVLYILALVEFFRGTD